MKIVCSMNGYPSIHEVSDIYYYDNKIILTLNSNDQLAAICNDIEYYKFMIRGLMTQNSFEIKSNYNFLYYYNS